VIGHRGAPLSARENTLAAFARAREVGADGVELDVRRTSDGVLVVHHDAAPSGGQLLASQSFDAVRGAVPWIPTLAEVFEQCAGWFVNVELKCAPWEPDADPDHEVARGAVELVRTHDVDVVVSSFDLGTVDAVREQAPELATGFLTQSGDLDAMAALAREHGHAWLHPNRAAVVDDPKAAVVLARDVGLRLSVWTVDDPTEIRALADAGVDAIITNAPDVALDALR